MRILDRSSKLAAALALAMTTVAVSAAHAAPKLVRMGGHAAVPDSPEGRVAAAWLRAFNTGSADSMAVFWEKHLAASARHAPPIERRREMYAHIREEHGRLQLVKVVEADPGQIVLGVRDAKSQRIDVVVHVEPEAPHGLLGVRFEANDGDDAPVADAGGPPLSPKQLAEEVAKMVDGRVAASEFAGVVLVERGGETVFAKGWGEADRASHAPIDVDTRFNLGSLNKLFTKLAIGQLAQQGRLAIADRVSKHLPGFDRAIGDRITIAQLLEHSSGMGDIFGPRYDAADKSKLRSVKDWLPLFEGQPLQFEPGSDRRYSNAGYVLLGAIVEQVSGRDYYEYLRENVYRPAGMASTDSYAQGDGTKNLANGYMRELGEAAGKERAWVDNASTRPGRGSPAGGGYSTAGDLARFVRAMRGNRLLDAAWTRWFFGGPVPVAGTGAAAAGGDIALGAGGGAPGINAALEIDGDQTVVVLSNLDPPSAEAVASRIRPLLRRTTWSTQ